MAETPVDIRGFKGINLRESSGFIQDEQLVMCENFNLGRTGELSKRTGFSLLHSGLELSGNVVTLGFYSTPTISQIIVSASNGLFYSSDGGSWIEISDTIQGLFAVQYAEIFYIISSDGVRSWDGATLSALISDSPSGTFGIVFKDRLFVLGNASERSRLYYSGIGDFTSWPADNFIDVAQGEGDRLTAAAVLQDILITFKTRTTWALYVQGPPANWVLRSASTETGCISGKAIREINNFLYFIGTRGVWQTDGFEFEEISQDINPVFLTRVVNDDTVNLDSAAEWDNKFIVLIHPQSTSNVFRYFVYQIETKGWSEWITASGIHPSSFLEVDSSTLGKRLFTGDLSGSGRVFRYGEDIYTDAGVEYVARFKTKQYDFSLPSIMKRGKWLGIDVLAEKSFSYNFNVDEADVAPVAVGTTSKRRIYKTAGPGYFRTWAFQLTEQSNTPFSFYQMTMWLHRKPTVARRVT